MSTIKSYPNDLLPLHDKEMCWNVECVAAAMQTESVGHLKQIDFVHNLKAPIPTGSKI